MAQRRESVTQPSFRRGSSLTGRPPGQAYFDRQTFLKESWDPYSHANQLLADVNDRDDPQVDFDPAENRAMYELDEVDNSSKQVLEEDWEVLLRQTSVAMEAMKDLREIDSALDSTQQTYNRLAVRSVAAYDEAKPLQEALSKLVVAEELAQELVAYLQRLTRLEACVAGDDLQLTCDLLEELEAQTAATPSLRQIRIVIAQRERLAHFKATLLRSVTIRLRGFDRLEEAVTCAARLGRATSDRIVTETVLETIRDGETTLKDAIIVSASLRRLYTQDPAAASRDYITGVTQALAELREQGDGLDALQQALATAFDNQGEENGADVVSALLEQSFDGSASMRLFFWREIAHKIGAQTRDAARRDAWVYKTLRAVDPDKIIGRSLTKGTLEYNVVFNSLRR
ncbi:hypothetical protein PYCC9005_002901 [Savitreella phatthalungensis]